VALLHLVDILAIRGHSRNHRPHLHRLAALKERLFFLAKVQPRQGFLELVNAVRLGDHGAETVFLIV
jgi:hypothetical protein